MIEGIDHIQITSPPEMEDEMRRFYCHLLGLREIDKPVQLKSRGGFWIDCGNMQLHVGIDRHVVDSGQSRRHVALAVADLARLRALLKSRDCIIDDDAAPIPGQRRFYTRDPAGNRVEFVERSPTPQAAVNK